MMGLGSRDIRTQVHSVFLSTSITSCTYQSHCCRRPSGVLCHCRVDKMLWMQNIFPDVFKMIKLVSNHRFLNFTTFPLSTPNRPLPNPAWPRALTDTDWWCGWHLSFLPLHWPSLSHTYQHHSSASSHHRVKKPGFGMRNAALVSVLF